MIDYVRGIKASVISGLVSSLISFVLLSLLISKDVMSPISLIPSLSSFAIIEMLLKYSIFGVFFALFYNKLYGKSSIKKALFFSIIAHIAYHWGIIFWYISVASILAYSFVQIAFIVSLLSIIIFGFLLGILWDKFETKDINLQQK